MAWESPAGPTQPARTGFGLSERQSQVAAILWMTDKEIAQVTTLSLSSVKKKIKAILVRTRSTTRTEAALKVNGCRVQSDQVPPTISQTSKL